MYRNLAIFKRIQGYFIPQSHIAGLGRWGSTMPEQKENIGWFHDTCNHDNCYLNIFTLRSLLTRAHKELKIEGIDQRLTK